MSSSKRLGMAFATIGCLLSSLLAEGLAHGQAQSQINQVCENRITLEVSGSSLKVPYCRNYALGQRNEAIERAVIVIQGTSRTADSYYSYVLNAAQQAGAATKTIILAPQFLIEEDITSFGLADDTLFWTNNGWKQGDQSLSTTQHPRPAAISSFDVMDTIMDRLANQDLFPGLKHIVIAGHSAGGRFVNRFAAGNCEEQTLSQRGVDVRYVIANPSSYLYFNRERRVAGTLNRFAVPDSTGCSYYNEYKYGLQYLNSYMAATGSEQIRSQYAQREVAYLLGGEDTDPNDSDLDTTCAAMFQGTHRLERGEVFYNYDLHYFNGRTLFKHKMAIIPGVGHSANGMFNSECGLRYLFDYNPSNLDCGEPVFSAWAYLPFIVRR